MTEKEWKNQKTRMTRKINSLRKSLLLKTTLVEKIAIKSEIKAAESALYEHKLNYHSLVSPVGHLPARLTPEFFMPH